MIRRLSEPGERADIPKRVAEELEEIFREVGTSLLLVVIGIVVSSRCQSEIECIYGQQKGSQI